jgi:hypothetical protein
MGCFCGKDAHPDANINRQVATTILSVFILLPNVQDHRHRTAGAADPFGWAFSVWTALVW